VPPSLDPLSFALGAALAVALAVLVGGLWLVTRPRDDAATERVARAVLEPLGDALLSLDAAGRVVRANAAAEQLLGASAAVLAGRPAEALGFDLAVLRHGAGRRPTTGLATIETARGPVLAHASVLRLAARPRRDLALLRPMTAAPDAERAPAPVAVRSARDEPLPEPQDVEPLEDDEATPPLVAAATALREPFARASASASYVRLLAPPLSPRAAEALARLEEALEDLARRLAALASEPHGGGATPVPLAPLVRDLLAAWSPPAGVRLRVSLEETTVHADERALRAALRELLRGAGAARGCELLVSVVEREGAALVEIAGGASRGDGAAAFARALLHGHGGRVEEEGGHGGAHVLRLVLPLAVVRAPALAR
jgi:hypothetical protein